MNRNRSCIFGRSTNSGKMSQGQRKTNSINKVFDQVLTSRPISEFKYLTKY